MWLLVGITVLLSGAAIADLTGETTDFLAETNDERSFVLIDKPIYERAESEVSEATRASEAAHEQQEKNRALVDKRRKRSSSAHRQASLFTPDQDEQVLSMEQRKTTLIKKHRDPLFWAWRGKRDLTHQYNKPSQRFNAW